MQQFESASYGAYGVRAYSILISILSLNQVTRTKAKRRLERMRMRRQLKKLGRTEPVKMA